MKKFRTLAIITAALCLVAGFAACKKNTPKITYGHNDDQHWTITGSTLGTPEDHVWDNGTIVTDYTPKTDGSILYKDAICGAEKTVVVPAGYRIHVQDTNGNPVEGVWVGICNATTCDMTLPQTDENGDAIIKISIKIDDHIHAQIKNSTFQPLPAGYTLIGGQTDYNDFNDKYEITITLGIAE